MCVWVCVCEWTGLWFCENQSCLKASLISTFLKKCDLEGGGGARGAGGHYNAGDPDHVS